MRATRTLLTLAQLGRTHWFFGNLYEAVVRVPDRLAQPAEPAMVDSPADQPAGLLDKGSPVRYFLPGLPIMLGSTIGSLVGGWKAPANRGWLVASTASTLAGAAVTAHLVANVNSKLFPPGQPATPEERQALLKRWYRWNAVRLAAAAAGWLTAERVRDRL